MRVLTAHEYFASIPIDERAKLLPGDFEAEGPGGRCDCWPAAAVAACVVCGWLPGCETDDDLKDGLRQFAALVNSGIIEDPDARLEDEMRGVAATLLDWGDANLIGLPCPSCN